MRRFFPVIALVAVLLTACISISTEPEVTPSPFFVTATLQMTGTSLPSVGTPPTGTATVGTTLPPSGTSAAGCKDSAVLLQDVTIADGTNVPPGSKFTKTWQFKNTGTCSWTGYTVVFTSGDRMGAPDSTPVPSTGSGQTVNVSVDLMAPTAQGAYTGFFAIENANGQTVPVGLYQGFWVKITVGTGAFPTAVPGTGTPAANTSPVSQPRGPASCKYAVSSSYLSEIANLINSARTQAGLSTLSINAQLAAAAQGHSIDMACHGLLSHTGSDGSSILQRLEAAGYTPTNYIEIIFGGGYPQDAFNWWMNDPTHRDAILSPNVLEMGVGYAYVADTAAGSYYTVDFGSP